MSYIGLDVGTSGCKAAVITSDGEISYSAAKEYPFISPRAGYVELDPAVVWKAVKTVLKQIAPHAQNAGVIAVSSIGEAMVILDKSENILYNGITYLDQRCQDTLSEIEKKISPHELHKITGVSTNQMFTLNKFIWFQRHMPDILLKADKYFLFGDYITYMLSGIRAIDPGSASRTMFFDAGNCEWSQKIADMFDIPIERFSKITAPGTHLAAIKEQLVFELGLPDSLTVIMGTHDQCAATLGSGSLMPGQVMLGQGSTESINCVIHKEQLNDLLIDRQLCFEPYVTDDSYIIITGNLTHGSSITWFTKTFYGDKTEETLDYSSLYQNCPDNAGDVFFLPHLSRVNLMDAQNQALGGFLGVDVTVTRSQMFRALLEGLCCESRTSMDIFDEIGVNINKITASGGASSSAYYMQMKADVLKRPIHILENPQAGIMGLGIISAVAAGDFASLGEAIYHFIKCRKSYTPQRCYDEQYQTYSFINKTIKQMYRDLH